MQIICTKREKIIDAFRSEKVKPRNLEVDMSKYSDLESKPSFEESISERTKIRRNKNLMHEIKNDKD